MNALEVEAVRKQYGEFVALDEVSVAVAEGSCTAIVGPNGAGKSSLFAVIGGQLRADRGVVRLNGRVISTLSAARRARLGLARTFQVARLPRSFTVAETILLARSAQRRGPMAALANPMRDRRLLDESAAALELVRLGPVANTPVASLTQGERKRLEFGMAAAQDASVLILDEPTAGMSSEDVITAIEVLRDLRVKRPQVSILFSSHDMDVVFGLAERVVVMNQGSVLADATPAEIAADQRVIDIYLGAT